MVDTVINLGALEHNYKKVKSLLGNSGLMSVIKSDAYGHGIREVLTKIFTFGERFFVISTPEDYKKVFDFPANFLLLYYDPGDIKTILEMHERRNVIFNLYSEALINVLPKNARIHIEIDTGMNRTGIKPENFEGVYKKAKSRFRVEGVFSHFPKANDREFSLRQVEIFDNLTKGIGVPRHINNSQGLINFGPLYDFSRVGILLYGYGMEGLKPVKGVYSKVIQVKRVKRGETVSYDGEPVDKDGFVGVVPVGYAMGVRRCKNFEVFIKGKYFRVKGWITMDAFMIFSEEKGFDVGDTVEILGENNNAQRIAKMWGTIPYEVLVSIRA